MRTLPANHPTHRLCADKGHILTWGINNFGQLGHGDRKDRSQPTIVESLCNEEIFDFALGSSFTVAITRSGKVYHWGYLCAPKNNLSPQSFSIDGVRTVLLLFTVPSRVFNIRWS